MQLLELPLVLVQDIIEQIVLSYSVGWDFTALLDLREVNKLFEREITKYFARHRLCGDANYHQDRSSRPFVTRLLKSYVGEQDRGESYFATEMHAVARFLHQNSTKYVDRADALHDVCDAIVSRGSHHSLLRNLPSKKPAKGWQPRPERVLQTGFAVAIVMHDIELVDSMLKAGTADPNEEGMFFGLPIHTAIRFGHPDVAQVLLDAGAKGIDDQDSRDLAAALHEAAKARHTEVLHLILSNIDSNEVGSAAGTIAECAAHYQHWDIVRLVLDGHWRAFTEERLRSVLCWAAKYGCDEVVRRISEFDPTVARNEKVWGCKRYPLREAAAGGHVSTVRLLLDNGALDDEARNHADVIARCVAKGGSLEVFELLRAQPFWRRRPEVSMLPIAAEHGRLDFVKYLVVNGLDVPQRDGHASSTAITNPNDLRYFALLQAVHSGHQGVVRWLIEEGTVDVNRNIGSTYPGLSPLILAVDSGNIEMVTLLIEEYSASMLPRNLRPHIEFSPSVRMARWYQIEDRLIVPEIGKHYASAHFQRSRRKVDEALQLAKGPQDAAVEAVEVVTSGMEEMRIVTS